MAVNCGCWIAYALLLQDFYIYFGNMPGLLLGLFYTHTCYKFSKEGVRGDTRARCGCGACARQPGPGGAAAAARP
jgi:hypothetical protein